MTVKWSGRKAHTGSVSTWSTAFVHISFHTTQRCTEIRIMYLGLPTPKKYRSFCTIRRFIKFMIVSSVSQKSWAWYILAVFPIGMAILPVLSPAFLFQMMEPYIQAGLSLIVRSQNYTTLPDSWICGRLRVFAGVLRIFAGVLRVILGAVMCIYVLVPGIWEWPGISLEHNQGASHVQSYSTCQLWGHSVAT